MVMVKLAVIGFVLLVVIIESKVIRLALVDIGRSFRIRRKLD